MVRQGREFPGFRVQPNTEYDRVTLMGHAGYSQIPGLALSRDRTNDTFDNPLNADTITDDLVTQIQGLLSPNGTLRICACGYRGWDLRQQDAWEASLQKFADKVGRRVCACSGPVQTGRGKFADSGCTCNAPEAWFCAEPKQGIPVK